MRVAPVGEIHTIEALAKPWVAFGIVLIPGYIDIALVVKSCQRYGLHCKDNAVNTGQSASSDGFSESSQDLNKT